MARKNVLKGLLDPKPPGAPPAPPPAAIRSDRGAIGAVSRSIADLKARAVVEIDPHLIDGGGPQDRLETDASGDATLRDSIAEYGQQVPVLVRPHPTAEGRFQIVYGRRRVLALRALGQPVKALVRALDDRELVMAQGQENTARRDLSFIEKANFARQLQDLGYDRKVICDALSIDKTLASRMLSLAERITPETIAVIGAAPAIGRDRWTELARLLDETETDAAELAAMVNLSAASNTSDARFHAAHAYVAGLAARRTTATADVEARREPTRLIRSAGGPPLAEARLGRNFCTLKLRLARTGGFESWLLDELPRLHADWQERHGGDDT